MFYFQLVLGAEQGQDDDDYYYDPDKFWVVPKDFYDHYHHLDDGCNQSNVPMPFGFSELAEACFEFDGDAEDGRELLIKAGFIEHQIIGRSNASKSI